MVCQNSMINNIDSNKMLNFFYIVSHELECHVTHLVVLLEIIMVHGITPKSDSKTN